MVLDKTKSRRLDFVRTDKHRLRQGVVMTFDLLTFKMYKINLCYCYSSLITLTVQGKEAHLTGEYLGTKYF